MALLQGNESLSTEKMGKMGEMGRLDECWAQLEREVEREGNIGQVFSFSLCLLSHVSFLNFLRQSFGNVFVNLMETLHRSSSSMVSFFSFQQQLPNNSPSLTNHSQTITESKKQSTFTIPRVHPTTFFLDGFCSI